MGILTAEARETIRQARAAQVAAERAALVEAGRIQVCRGCGCDADTDSLAYTAGCSSCWDRRRFRLDERRRAYLRSEERKAYDRTRKRRGYKGLVPA